MKGSLYPWKNPAEHLRQSDFFCLDATCSDAKAVL